MANKDYTFCCQMRRKFIVAIVADDRSVPLPVEMADCVVQWEPQIVIRAPYCSFCGKRIDPNEPARAIMGLPDAGIA